MTERFIMTELEGWPIRTPPTRSGPRPGLSCHVIDTALNHRVVAVFRSEDRSKTALSSERRSRSERGDGVTVIGAGRSRQPLWFYIIPAALVAYSFGLLSALAIAWLAVS